MPTPRRRSRSWPRRSVPRSRGRPSGALCRGLGHPSHHHVGRDGAQPRAAWSRAASRAQVMRELPGRGPARSARSTTRCAGARRRRFAASLCGDFRRVRRHHHAGRRRRGAEGSRATGDPAFCTLWTLTGLPALSLPLLTGEGGLPLGVQLVGAPGGDARLLRTRPLIGMLAPQGRAGPALGRRRKAHVSSASRATRRKP